MLDINKVKSTVVTLLEDDNAIVILNGGSNSLPLEVGETLNVSVEGVADIVGVTAQTERSKGKTVPLFVYQLSKAGKTLDYTVILPASVAMLAGKPAVLTCVVKQNPRKAGGKIVEPTHVTVGTKTTTWAAYATNDRISKFFGIDPAKLSSGLPSLVKTAAKAAADTTDEDDF